MTCLSPWQNQQNDKDVALNLIPELLYIYIICWPQNSSLVSLWLCAVSLTNTKLQYTWIPHQSKFHFLESQWHKQETTKSCICFMIHTHQMLHAITTWIPHQSNSISQNLIDTNNKVLRLLNEWMIDWLIDTDINIIHSTTTQQAFFWRLGEDWTNGLSKRHRQLSFNLIPQQKQIGREVETCKLWELIHVKCSWLYYKIWKLRRNKSMIMI